MPRPIRCRRVRFNPKFTYFKPAGTRMIELKEVILSVEESEAIRLVDLEEIEQTKAGEMMRVSQPTFSRILKSARKKVADGIINGKAIRIEGGNYSFK